MSFKKNFFKSIGSFAIFNYITQGLEFFSTIILSRLLLPEEYGFVAIILIFSGFIQLFSDVGIGSSVVRSDYGETFHRHLYSLSVWLGTFLATIMMLLSYPIGILFNDMGLVIPAIIMSFRFVLDSFTYIPYAILAKKLDFKNVGIAKLYGTGLQIFFTIVLAFLGLSYWSLIIPLVFGPVFQLFFLRTKVKLPFRLYGWKATLRIANKIKSLMGYLSLLNLITYWSSNADKLIIARLYTQAELGLYNRAFRFVMISSRLITGIFHTVLFPSLKKLMSENGPVNKEYLDILRIISLFNMPIVLILLLFPNELVLILWGRAWIGVSEFLPYIAIILIFKPLLQTTSSVYILYEKEKVLTYVNIITSFLKLTFVLIGSLISLMHMILFICLNLILVNVPLHGYFGFYKSFGFKKFALIKFWIPMMIFGCGLVYSVYFHDIILRILMLVLLNSYLIYGLRKTINETIFTLKRKIF